MSSRGRGSCPRCDAEYFNRSKPPNCGNCGHHLGGTFQGARKKTKSASPAVLEISQGVFSCRTTGRDDRCFVTSSGDMWLCTHEACKVARSVYVNSDLVSQYECDKCKIQCGKNRFCQLKVYFMSNHSEKIDRGKTGRFKQIPRSRLTITSL